MRTKKSKSFTLVQIAEQYNALSSAKKVGILWDALDYMNQYNGRSKYYCIAFAMGYNTTDGDKWTKH